MSNINPPVRTRTRIRPARPPAPVEMAPETDDEIEEPKAGQPYEVGNCKPPMHTRFQPGRSGNPNGRPKDSKNFHKLVLKAMLKPVTVRTAKGTKRVSSVEALLMKTVENATKGNLRASEKLFEWYIAASVSREGPAYTKEEALSESDKATLAMLQSMMATAPEAEVGEAKE